MRPWVIRYIVPEGFPLIGGLDLSIPGYFFFLTLGFMLATNIIIREANRAREDVRAMLDLAMMFLVGGLVGGRLGHIIFEMPSLYVEHPEYILQFWRGGLVYYGGLIFCTMIAIVYCWKTKIDFWRVADIYAPAVSFGLIFGRMGCLSAGCCYGKPADFPGGWSVPWAITFYSGQVPTELRGIPLHPTQIYEAVSCCILYICLIVLRRRQTFDGQILWTFLGSYAVLRTIIEIFRFDEDRGVYMGGHLSTSQIISLILFTGAVTMMPLLRRRAQKRGNYGLGPAWPSLPQFQPQTKATAG
jgi:phosphatidylglycerol:prolipoprotein diacylglycerol transferase